MKTDLLENFNPSICICGRVRRLNRVIGNIFRKYLLPFDITDSQLTLLFILSKKNGLKQKELCDLTCLEKSSLNRNLSRLIDRQLISRDHFPVISITQKGLSLVAEIIPGWRKAMEEAEELLGREGVQAVDLLAGRISKEII